MEWWNNSLFLLIFAIPILVETLIYAYHYFKKEEKQFKEFADKQVEMARKEAKIIIDQLPSCTDDSTIFSSTETRE